jgi:outer membrane lipoprotein SlyB
MKSFIIAILLACSTLFVNAQTRSDTIEVRKNRFIQHGLVLKPKQMLEMMSYNEDAFKQMKVAKGSADAANVLGFIGGALIGYPLGTLVGGGKPNWGLAAAGAGVLVVAIPFVSSYNRHAHAAVRIYNEDIRGQNSARLRFKVGLAPTAACVRITF